MSPNSQSFRVEGSKSQGQRAPSAQPRTLRRRSPRWNQAVLHEPGRVLQNREILSEFSHGRSWLVRHRLQLRHRGRRQRLRGQRLEPRRGTRTWLQRPEHRCLHHWRFHG